MFGGRCVHIRVEVRSQYHTSFSSTLHILFCFRQRLSLNLEFISLSKLVNQLASGIHLPSFPSSEVIEPCHSIHGCWRSKVRSSSENINFSKKLFLILSCTKTIFFLMVCIIFFSLYFFVLLICLFYFESRFYYIALAVLELTV